MKFILTIDTEGDNQWDHGRKLTVENIQFIPRFQDLCNKYLIMPTYLVTSEVCEDPFANEILKDYEVRGLAEIGAHLHSWSTPPFLDKDGYRYNDPNHAFANELPADLLAEKIKNLTSQIETSFGKHPLSFRSGRFGLNMNVAKELANNSYIVDSSVTPYTDWSNHKGIPGNIGGPDFFDETPFPYKFNFPGNSLLEIPVTILPTRFPLNRSQAIARHYFRKVDDSTLLKVFRKLLFSNQPLWLRPYPWMDIDLFDEILNESLNIKLPFVVMIFHSSELMPGCSIYNTDNDAIEKFYVLLEQLFILLQNRNINSVTLTDAARNIRNENLFLG